MKKLNLKLSLFVVFGLMITLSMNAGRSTIIINLPTDTEYVLCKKGGRNVHKYPVGVCESGGGRIVSEKILDLDPSGDSSLKDWYYVTNGKVNSDGKLGYNPKDFKGYASWNWAVRKNDNTIDTIREGLGYPDNKIALYTEFNGMKQCNVKDTKSCPHLKFKDFDIDN